MNVRITPRGQPQRTDTYTGIVPPLITSPDGYLVLFNDHRGATRLPLRTVAAIALDEDGGGDL